MVEGPSGWSEAPCASTTSTRWYFASGATSNGNSLYVSLFNPTTSVAVVDLDEGPRMMTNVVDCPFEDLRIGMPLRVTFQAISDEFTIPVFVRA